MKRRIKLIHILLFSFTMTTMAMIGVIVGSWHLVSTECSTKPCNSHAILYPSFLHMAGRYNSLFGYDRKCLSDSRYLRSLMGNTCDRLVLHLFEEVQDP